MGRRLGGAELKSQADGYDAAPRVLCGKTSEEGRRDAPLGDLSSDRAFESPDCRYGRCLDGTVLSRNSNPGEAVSKPGGEPDKAARARKEW